MNKIIIPILALLLIGGSTSCGNKIDTDKEQNAIINMLEQETDAHLKRDFERWSETWVNDETAIFSGAGKENFALYTGWDKIGSVFSGFYENNPEPSTYKYEKSNFKVKFYGDGAWANYDEKITSSEGETIQISVINKVLVYFRLQ